MSKNPQLSARRLAEIMAKDGKYKFGKETLRKIITRQYPPLKRLGIGG